jgi:hypothetical protein
MKLSAALSFCLVFLFPAAVGFAAQTSGSPESALISELSSIEKDLLPHHGQAGTIAGARALEQAEQRFEPLLRDHQHEMMSDPSLMTATLKVEAALCDVDTMYNSVTSLLDLRASKYFESSLKSLPKPDRACIRQAIQVLLQPKDS